MKPNSRSQYKLSQTNELAQLWMPTLASKSFRSGRRLFNVNKNQQTYGLAYESMSPHLSYDFSAKSLPKSTVHREIEDSDKNSIEAAPQKINPEIKKENDTILAPIKFSQSQSLSPVPIEKKAAYALQIYNNINKDLAEKFEINEKIKQREEALKNQAFQYERVRQELIEKESRIARKIEELKRKKEYEKNAYKELHQFDEDSPYNAKQNRSYENPQKAITDSAIMEGSPLSAKEKFAMDSSLSESLRDTYNLIQNKSKTNIIPSKANTINYDINTRYTKQSPKPQISYPIAGFPGAMISPFREDSKNIFHSDEKLNRFQGEKSLAGYGNLIIQSKQS
ncbi:unnamed protein product [Blepharisma stoltei]|uniref:Uncharacterized protein n=1 Tax=Blepharisma stoltei TaxID=1481888 RepID=A0AAU9IVX5_9CILI|nr:unnamed protein product [Blepharisma stoltei]